MANWHETGPKVEFDTVGWLFVAVAVVAVVAAVAVIYGGNDALVANSPLSNAVAPSG